MSLLQKTLRLLSERTYNPDELCREIGVSRRWLYRLQAGDFEDPGVNKIEKLHQLLASAPKKAA